MSSPATRKPFFFFCARRLRILFADSDAFIALITRQVITKGENSAEEARTAVGAATGSFCGRNYWLFVGNRRVVCSDVRTNYFGIQMMARIKARWPRADLNLKFMLSMSNNGRRFSFRYLQRRIINIKSHSNGNQISINFHTRICS